MTRKTTRSPVKAGWYVGNPLGNKMSPPTLIRAVKPVWDDDGKALVLVFEVTSHKEPQSARLLWTPARWSRFVAAATSGPTNELPTAHPKTNIDVQEAVALTEQRIPLETGKPEKPIGAPAPYQHPFERSKS